jgi:hypothetical protein
VPVLHFWCFQEADRSSLEENCLIRIGGGEDSCDDFVIGELFEKGAMALKPVKLRIFQFVVFSLNFSNFSRGGSP